MAAVDKFLAALDVGIISLVHEYAKGLKAVGDHAFDAFFGQHFLRDNCLSVTVQ